MKIENDFINNSLYKWEEIKKHIYSRKDEIKTDILLLSMLNFIQILNECKK